MLPTGYEPTISADERPQTYTLDRAATGTGTEIACVFKVLFLTVFHTKHTKWNKKGKGLPQQAEVAEGVPGRLRPQIFLTFGTTRVVGRQP